MFLHICFVSLCVCGRVSLQRRANIEVTGIYKKTAKTAIFLGNYILIYTNYVKTLHYICILCKKLLY